MSLRHLDQHAFSLVLAILSLIGRYTTVATYDDNAIVPGSVRHVVNNDTDRRVSGSVLPSASNFCPLECHCIIGESVQCSGVDLYRLPAVMDRTTLLLTLTSTSVSEIRRREFTRFSRLRGLEIRRNKVTNVSAESFYGLPQLIRLVLDEPGITNFPTGTLAVLTKLQVIVLASKHASLPQNDICQLLDIQYVTLKYFRIDFFHACFENLAISQLTLQRIRFKDDSITRRLLGNLDSDSLVVLKIIDCGVIQLGDRAFHGLKVKSLQLNANRIHTIRNDDFNHITQLHYLSLTRNNVSVFDSNMISDLRELNNLDLSRNRITKLSFNAIQRESGSSRSGGGRRGGGGVEAGEGGGGGGESLPIETLNLSHNRLERIEAEDFVRLPALRELYMDFCYLKTVDRRAFLPLGYSLQTLSLLENPLPFPETISSLRAFQQYTKLDMLKIGMPFTRYLNSSSFSGLTSGLSVKQMTLKFGSLREIGTNSFKPFANLTSLTFIGDSIDAIRRSSFHGLRSICHLYLNALNMKNMYSGKYLEGSNLNALLSLDMHSNQIRRISDLSGYTSLQNLNLNNNNIKALHLDILEQVKNLLTLNLSNNKVTVVEYAHFNFSPKLEILLLKNNLLQQLSSKILFQPLRNLKYIDLSNNIKLGTNTDTIVSIFRNISALEELHLDRCSISELKRDMFENTNNIKTIVMNNNKIDRWRPFPNLKSLENLYLNHNNLVSVDVQDFYALPSIRRLSLSSNPFACDCDLRQFLDFVEVNNIFIGQVASTYICASPAGDKGRSIVRMTVRQYDCVSTLAADRCVAVTLAVVLAVTLAAALYRGRWYIRYYAFLLRSRYNRKTRHFEYNAFVAHSSGDNKWIMSELLPNMESSTSNIKLCLHERDWLAGKLISDNIVESIECSSKILLIISNNFLTSKWCSMELSLAYTSSPYGVVIVLLERLRPELVPVSLRNLMTSQTYLEWNPAVVSKEAFWNALRNAIK